MKISGMGEDALIERLLRLVPVDSRPGHGPGDDCAVVDEGGDLLRLLKTDAMVGGIHFQTEEIPERVGRKAIARVLSDFAAMGGWGNRFLVTLAIPPETDFAWAEGIYRGMGACLRMVGALLVGGETTRLAAGAAVVISVAAEGRVRREELVLRSGGKVGDLLLVTGTLGGSIHGRHLDFTPRLAEAAWLVKHFKPTAMMDLSDGLASDLPRLAAASGCGFHIDVPALPCAEGSESSHALHDGEDYELLFSIDPSISEALFREWRMRFPELNLSRIGKLTRNDEWQDIGKGWDHFGE
jgi:thiamine-monophosphate kinase